MGGMSQFSSEDGVERIAKRSFFRIPAEREAPAKIDDLANGKKCDCGLLRRDKPCGFLRRTRNWRRKPNVIGIRSWCRNLLRRF